MLSDRPYFVLCDAPGVFGRNEGAACTGAIVFRHACLYNDLNVPFCMLFSDSSELFLFILCEFFFCSDPCRTCERCESPCHGGKKKCNEFRCLRKVRKGFQS